jgi:SAM-dependent methyltransferase
LRCPVCRKGALAAGTDRAAVQCSACSRPFPASKGVVDLLVAPHSVVAREQAAVSGLDAQDASAAQRLAERLLRLDGGELTEADRLEFPCLRHASDCLDQLREVLRLVPLAPGDLVVELGADHCWASGLLLDAGCRVLALDITDHMTLAARAGDPSLCRVVADMNDMPVRDGQADVVWATAAAHHSWSLDRTFAEAARVLRPGGRLYFCCEPMPSWLRYPFGRSFGHAERELGINETWLPRRSWLAAATQAGFAARIVLPSLDRRTVEKRLKAKRLPAALAPLAVPVLKLLQVSVHLLATRVDPGQA